MYLYKLRHSQRIPTPPHVIRVSESTQGSIGSSAHVGIQALASEKQHFKYPFLTEATTPVAALVKEGNKRRMGNEEGRPTHEAKRQITEKTRRKEGETRKKKEETKIAEERKKRLEEEARLKRLREEEQRIPLFSPSRNNLPWMILIKKL